MTETHDGSRFIWRDKDLTAYGADRDTAKQEWVCDDCAIARARAFKPTFDALGTAARAGYDHRGCTCQVISDRKVTYPAELRKACRYHIAANLFPEDHSIPWNCPTFYDGCNCTKPKEPR